jgi:hypothetical protein
MTGKTLLASALIPATLSTQFFGSLTPRVLQHSACRAPLLDLQPLLCRTYRLAQELVKLSVTGHAQTILNVAQQSVTRHTSSMPQPTIHHYQGGLPRCSFQQYLGGSATDSPEY